MSVERSQEEQIYDLLTTSSKTYSEIAVEVGCATSTVSAKARKLVSAYNVNPSVLRGSRRPKYEARYCQNLLCHCIAYFDFKQIRSLNSFYCSEECNRRQNIKIPSYEKIIALYQKFTFDIVADKLNISYGELARLFEHYNIEPLDFPETALVVTPTVAQRQTQKIKQRRSSFANTRTGFRDHLGFVVRSRWENNFCLYLIHQGIDFEYEPKTFYFDEKTGPKAYVPDFKLNVNGKEVWVEVKGHYLSKDGSKMKRMKKHYPEIFEKMTYVVDKEGSKSDLAYKKIGIAPFIYYNDLVKEFKSKLKNWEG